jgi:hypothetical protein
MPRIRNTIAQIAAFSIVATQLLCGCVGTPSIDVAATAHASSTSVDTPPCHGDTPEPSHHAGESPDEHDCAHCQSDVAMASVSDAPSASTTTQPFNPDLGPAPERLTGAIAPTRYYAGNGPPSGAPALNPETLVSLNILLLI